METVRSTLLDLLEETRNLFYGRFWNPRETRSVVRVFGENVCKYSFKGKNCSIGRLDTFFLWEEGVCIKHTPSDANSKHVLEILKINFDCGDLSDDEILTFATRLQEMHDAPHSASSIYEMTREAIAGLKR